MAAPLGSGWSPENGEYRASMVDNYGHAAVYRGLIDGDRLIFIRSPTLRFACASPGTRAILGDAVEKRNGHGRRRVVPHRGVPDGVGQGSDTDEHGALIGSMPRRGRSRTGWLPSQIAMIWEAL